MNRIWMRQKMAARGLPAELAGELEHRLDLKPFKVTEKGTSEEKGAGIIAAIVFLILMYSTFFMYGYQVMRGVIEEKSSRIVEIIVASVRPVELMVGKIVASASSGLTQYLVWSLVAMNLSLPVFAGMLSGGDLGVPRVPVSMLGYFILFFILGYFLYASVYTRSPRPSTRSRRPAVHDDPDDHDPRRHHGLPRGHEQPHRRHGALLLAFPFTSSLVMFLRTAVSEPPAWQILLSIALLISTTAASRGSPAASTASASSCTARSPRSPRSSAGRGIPPARWSSPRSRS